jgi:hypothetical protein
MYLAPRVRRAKRDMRAVSCGIAAQAQKISAKRPSSMSVFPTY